APRPPSQVPAPTHRHSIDEQDAARKPAPGVTRGSAASPRTDVPPPGEPAHAASPDADSTCVRSTRLRTLRGVLAIGVGAALISNAAAALGADADQPAADVR